MIEKTKQVNKINLGDNVIKMIIHAELYKTFRELLQNSYDDYEKKFFNEKWISFSMNGHKGYWNKQTNIAIPVFKLYSALKENYFNISSEKLELKSIKVLFDKDFPSEILNGIRSSKTYDGGHWIGFEGGSYCVETCQFSNWNDNDSIKLGVVRVTYAEFKKNIISHKYTIIEDAVFKKVIALLKGRSVDKIEEKEVDKLIEIFSIDSAKIKKEVMDRVKNNYTMSNEIFNLYIEELLTCDKKRVDLENYSKKCVEDVNLGHWELWFDEGKVANEGEALVTIEKPLIARNPLVDIHYDGLIGIDFGTKSTIVSERNGKNKTTLMRVGIGQLAKAVESYHYENPTIMEFRDLIKFLKDYGTSEGRPKTSIDDLRVSHTANNDLKACTISDEFYSYFYDIKQWCGDTERNIKIKDQKDVERVLPAFVDLNQDEFNPLELYAYYLGLYINNMRNGIYIDYILSFPVTYEKAVKEKILSSFTEGLKKSLPKEVLNDKEVMSKFRVRQGVSEPAAYAITALQGYGFEPDENEKVFYSIFDFGGGTTDFDFGLWRLSDDSKPEEELFDYVIEHFGSEGDKYLGGENLLELLAFEVFKANVMFLGKTKKNDNDDKFSAGFSFSKPKECDKFAGCETFVDNSQEARRNTKQLIEALRPFWEGIIGVTEERNDEVKKDEESGTEIYKGYIFKNTDDCKFPIINGEIELDLFDKDGHRKQKQKLFIENKAENIDVNLIEILEKRIERGVENFFHSIMLAFRNESVVKSGADCIQIFLAGNSSKSPILRKLFEKHIKIADEESKNIKDVENYHLFPPLGTKEAMDIQKERGVMLEVGDVSAPTGKTGVAYGLIAGRQGGRIKVISEVKADGQTKFRFNIGIEKRGKFLIKFDRNRVEYGQWVKFVSASQEDFEIYYTSLPSAGKMFIDETGIYNKRCRLSKANPDAYIYIRSFEDSPEDIEYCISMNDEPDDDVEIKRIHLGE